MAAIGTIESNDFLKKLGPVKVAVLGAAAVVLLVLFAFLILRNSNASMSPIYNNLAADDMNAVMSQMDMMGISYQFADNQILVDRADVDRIRMTLAQEGLPRSGSFTGYEVFDKSESLGTSSFVYNINLLRALEGELARSIARIDSIENAKVHLVLPKRELFTRQQQVPSASVVVKMRSGKKLNSGEVNAIRHLVATAVSDLKLSRITIIDQAGNLLARGVTDDNDPSSMAAASEEMRIAEEKRLRNVVEEMLERLLGPGKVQAELSLDMNFDRVVINSEIYDPEGQVVRSVQTIEETENSQDKNMNTNVTVQNNLPEADPSQDGVLSQTNSSRIDETTNFEISKTVKNQIQETGTVNRLSISVVIDGTYKDGADGKPEYVARTPEELKEIEEIVKGAVGFSADRGDVIKVSNIRFNSEIIDMMETSPFDFLKDDLSSIIQTLIVGGVAALLILLVVRPIAMRFVEASRAMAEEQREQAEAEALAAARLAATGGRGGAYGEGGYGGSYDGTGEGDDSVDMDRIEGRMRSSHLRRLNELVEKHPEEALNVVRNWLMNDKEK